MEKLGFFLCTGCGIGEAVDEPGLLKTAIKDGKAAVAKSHARLCESSGCTLVHEAIVEHGLDAVVLGACSQREMTATFRFDDVHVERASLREQVAWCCTAEQEDRQALAEDYARMACIKTAKSSRPVKLQPEVTRRLLVVGGGVAGMSAALEASAAGYEVVLLEKGSELGGRAAACKSQVPGRAPFQSAEDNEIPALIEQVRASARIEVKAASEIASISGAPGAFKVTLQGQAEPFTVGAIVVAVGGTPYPAARLSHLGYGTHANVVTQQEFEALAREGRLVRPSDGKPIEAALFVQCAGSRDADHLAYCSMTCCPETIKQLQYFKAAAGPVRTHVVYKDMRVPGLLEAFYRAAQSGGTRFIQGEVKRVEGAGERVKVGVDDALTGTATELEVDLVVLATGIVSNAKDASVLKLTYRLGAELPAHDGFNGSHFICFPYETQRTGIYAAGTVHHPMLRLDAAMDGAGAAHKAIQCVEMTSRGEAVHPRAGDLTVPEFFLQRCTQCKRCTEECPFGTLDEDEKGTPKPNPERCRRCGVCMGACPERIVSFANYSVDMVGSMIKSIPVPDEFEEKPRILCLVCENDVVPAIDMAAALRKQLSPWVRIIPLRCLGSTNLQWVNDSLIKGIDGVMLIGCRRGDDDYQCHFVKGSELCNVRMSKIQETLQRLMLEPERIQVEQFDMADYENLFPLVNGFVERVVALGPNPNKG